MIQTELSIRALICGGRARPDAAESMSSIGLPPAPGEKLQARLHDLALRLEPRCCHRLGKKRVVDLDVGPHGDALLVFLQVIHENHTSDASVQQASDLLGWLESPPDRGITPGGLWRRGGPC
jgi:hypothetical protein